jgi:hypothetical protein
MGYINEQHSTGRDFSGWRECGTDLSRAWKWSRGQDGSGIDGGTRVAAAPYNLVVLIYKNQEPHCRTYR